MDKLKMMSMDKVSENIEKIKALFPNCVTEVKRGEEVEYAIDFDVLKQELSKDLVDEREERYQMTWPDKKKSVVLANSPINKTLRPCREESVDFDNTENLYIEGDNLEVLKLLQETYLGKIKMIYIDPPYNTGNDSFVYNDVYSMSEEEFLSAGGYYDEDGNRVIDVKENNESNGRFHTDWLNMIYPRLRLARDLLSDDGVIFISIDDNEQANLKKVCDEIFGASNFIANLVWEKKKKGSFLSNSITNIKEYIFVYSKEKDSFEGLIGEINNSVETYPCVNAVNKRELRTIPAGVVSKYADSDFFMPKGSIISDTTMNLVLHSNLVIKNSVLAEELIIEGNWRYSQEAMKNFAKNNELYITRDLYLRRIVSETRYKTLKDLLPRVGDDNSINHTCKIEINDLFSSGWGSNEDADEELRLIMGSQKMLDYPKPTRLLFKIFASYHNAQNSIILDFFSGSATTAHAVMQLNAEDGGKRKFIMVQIPDITYKGKKESVEDKNGIKISNYIIDEKTGYPVVEKDSEARKAGYYTITQIGKERIRRAGKKIKEESPLTTQNLDTGFRVLKLDSSNMLDVYYNPDKIEQTSIFDYKDNIKADRSAEDLLFQIMLDMGVTLSAKIEEKEINGTKVFAVDGDFLVACFADNLTDATLTEIAKLKPRYAAFRDSSFANDSVAKNCEQIFATYSPNTKCTVV